MRCIFQLEYVLDDFSELAGIFACVYTHLPTVRPLLGGVSRSLDDLKLIKSYLLLLFFRLPFTIKGVAAVEGSKFVLLRGLPQLLLVLVVVIDSLVDLDDFRIHPVAVVFVCARRHCIEPDHVGISRSNPRRILRLGIGGLGLANTANDDFDIGFLA